MFESKEPSMMSIFSSYLVAAGVFAASSGLLYLFLANQELIYSFFYQYNFERMGMFLNFFSVILIFLICNTCFYAFISTRQLRMMVFATAFLTGGWVQLMGAVAASGMSTIPETFDITYGTYSRLLIALGLLVGNLIPPERVHFEDSRIPRGLLPAGGFLVLLLIQQWFSNSISQWSVDPKIFQMVVEYGVAALYLLGGLILIRNYSSQRNQFQLQMAMGIMVVIFAQALKIVYGSPEDLTYLLFTFYQAVGFVILFVAMFRDAIHMPLEQLISAEKQITLYAENLEKIVERRTAEIKQVNNRFIKEMDYARSIQQCLLPPRKLNFKKVSFTAEYFPCERLSGDFFDIYRIDDENIGMYVLDVSGHGISAALMTMFCNNYIKSTERLIKRYRGLKPHRNLKHFYEEFNKMNFPEEMHMVIFYASYNLNSQLLTYASGGMNCFPIVVHADGSHEYLDQSSGFPICKFSEFYEPEYVSVRIQLREGDRLIFYTDGLTDVEKNNALDTDQLLELMKANRTKSVRTLNREITSRIGQVGGQLDDDITYFIMEVKDRTAEAQTN